MLGVFAVPVAEERTLGVFASELVEGEVVEGLTRVERGREVAGSIPIEVPALDIGLLAVPLAGVFKGDRFAVTPANGLEGELI